MSRYGVSSDDARRAHFTEQLREKLQEPTFRSTPGFPSGDDEDILALSNPPYYTACPNPFLGEYIKHTAKSYHAGDAYHGPFAADVSEARTEDIYAAHAWSLKVPPKAIARYILHYTAPGDLVLDVPAAARVKNKVARQRYTLSPRRYRCRVQRRGRQRDTGPV